MADMTIDYVNLYPKLELFVKSGIQAVDYVATDESSPLFVKVVEP